MPVPKQVGADSVIAPQPLRLEYTGLSSEARTSPWRGRQTDGNNDKLLTTAGLSV